MSALRRRTNYGRSDTAATPYLSWSAVAEMTGAYDMASRQDSQAMKEERIWRALADEPSSETVDRAPEKITRPAE